MKRNLHVNLTTILDLTIYRLGQYSVIIPQYKEEGELGHARLSTDHHRLYTVPTVQGKRSSHARLQHLYIQGPPGMHRPC